MDASSGVSRSSGTAGGWQYFHRALQHEGSPGAAHRSRRWWSGRGRGSDLAAGMGFPGSVFSRLEPGWWPSCADQRAADRLAAS